MKLIKLEILNLASLDNKDGETINFEEGALGESNIFSIVGPMGSGKSTILDAICLALYNRAPRYPRKKNEKKSIEIYGEIDTEEKYRLAPTDCRNILTNGKKYGYSRLTFLANNGCMYRAEWSVQFKLKRYDNVVTKLVKIIVENGQPKEEDADWNQLPNIIGLDYDQFLRTVLIAQGSFANFLNAKEDERYELLEKLVGCEETYSRIAREIKAKKSKAVEEFTTLSATCKAEEQHKLPDEQLAKLQEDIRQLEEAEKLLADQLQKVKTELQWYADDETKTKAIEEQQAHLQAAKEALEKIRSYIDRLDLHDALSPAIDLLREVKRFEKEIAELNERIAAGQGKIKTIEENKQHETTALKQLETQAAEAQKSIEAQLPHIKAARELLVKMESAKRALEEKLQAKASSEKEQKTAQKALNDNEVQIKATNEAVEEAAQSVKATEDAIAQQKEVLAKAVEAIAKTLETKKKEIEGKSAEELQNNKTLADQAWTDLKQAIDVLGRLDEAKSEKSKQSARLDLLQRRNEVIAKALAELNIEELTKEVETLRKTHTLMTSENWQQHRSVLEEGKACPLCGAVEHPYKQDDTLFAEAESELGDLLKTKEQTLKAHSDQKASLTNEKSGNEGTIAGIIERLKQLDKEIENLDSQWDEIQRQHPDFPKAKNELETLKPAFEARQKAADNALKAFNAVQQEIVRLTQQKEQADKNQAVYEQTSREQLEKAKVTLTTAQTKLAEVKALTPNLQKQLEEKQKSFAKAEEEWKSSNEGLKQLENSYKAELNGEHPDTVEERLQKAKANCDEAVKKKQDYLHQLEVQLKEIGGALTAQESQLKEANTNLESKNVELKQWIDEYNAKEDRIRTIDKTIVEEMANASDRWDAIRQEKEKRSNAVVSATTLLESAQKAYEEHQKAKPEKPREELLEQQEALQKESLNDELVALKAKKKNHDDAVQSLGDKAEELDRLTKAMEDWTAISDAIGSDGKTLRKIAQCYTLSFLIEHANAEIRKFNSRYELLQVKHSLGIRVIDHDRADDVRDTTSLSGGETFIVSLGLALGLSSLSSRNVSFENLFIDEGFGSLDPDTLSIVIDSLAMLQSKQGKKVGVISHTDTMSERITTQIRVVKNGNSGSSHIEIYPI